MPKRSRGLFCEGDQLLRLVIGELGGLCSVAAQYALEVGERLELDGHVSVEVYRFQRLEEVSPVDDALPHQREHEIDTLLTHPANRILQMDVLDLVSEPPYHPTDIVAVQRVVGRVHVYRQVL